MRWKRDSGPDQIVRQPRLNLFVILRKDAPFRRMEFEN